MNVASAHVGSRNPGIARDEDDRVGTGVAAFIAHNNRRSGLLEKQYLLRVFMLVERDRLFGSQRFREHKKVLRFSKLTINFDRERQSLQRAGPVNKPVAICLLQDKRSG